jgi:hypothetical protein
MRTRFVRNPDVCLTCNHRRQHNDSERRHAEPRRRRIGIECHNRMRSDSSVSH